LGKSGAGRRSLKKYEVINLIFFLCLILALGVLVTFVFRIYGTRNEVVSQGGEKGIVAEALYPGNDLGMFQLGTKVFETSRQYRSQLEIPVTDDGFLRELFNIPGVREVIVDQRSIIIKKDPSASWESIRPKVQEAVMRHLHLHY
jgi:hypothetical protein